jgi:hypothetical protein
MLIPLALLLSAHRPCRLPIDNGNGIGRTDGSAVSNPKPLPKPPAFQARMYPLSHNPAIRYRRVSCFADASAACCICCILQAIRRGLMPCWCNLKQQNGSGKCCCKKLIERASDQRQAIRVRLVPADPQYRFILVRISTPSLPLLLCVPSIPLSAVSAVHKGARGADGRHSTIRNCNIFRC